MAAAAAHPSDRRVWFAVAPDASRALWIERSELGGPREAPGRTDVVLGFERRAARGKVRVRGACAARSGRGLDAGEAPAFDTRYWRHRIGAVAWDLKLDAGADGPGLGHPICGHVAWSEGIWPLDGWRASKAHHLRSPGLETMASVRVGQWSRSRDMPVGVALRLEGTTPLAPRDPTPSHTHLWVQLGDQVLHDGWIPPEAASQHLGWYRGSFCAHWGRGRERYRMQLDVVADRDELGAWREPTPEGASLTRIVGALAHARLRLIGPEDAPLDLHSDSALFERRTRDRRHGVRYLTDEPPSVP